MNPYRIAVIVKGTERFEQVCPGDYQTEIQAKAEILYRNERFPLAPHLERVVIALVDAR